MRFNTLKGAALGASLVYFLDPVEGRARRAVLSERVLSLSRAALASRQVRRRAVPGANQASFKGIVADAGRRRLLWRRATATVPRGWDHPMTTVHIDVDDRYALPDVGLQAASRRTRGAHRRFTRLSRGTTGAFPGTGATFLQ